MKKIIILLFSVIMLFVACDKGRVFDENKQIKEQKWEKNDTVTLEAMITDTLSLNKIFVNVRNNGNYPFCNLFMFIKTTLPDGRNFKDTVECVLADPTGNWVGKGFGSLWDNRILYRKNVIFPFKGKYTFKIVHGMRASDDILQGISDIGIRIQKQTEEDIKTKRK